MGGKRANPYREKAYRHTNTHTYNTRENKKKKKTAYKPSKNTGEKTWILNQLKVRLCFPQLIYLAPYKKSVDYKY